VMARLAGTACENADSCRAPECGRGVEAAHAQPFAEDQSGTEETDSRDDLGRDAGWACISRHECRENHECRCAQGDQRIGAQPG
jgi:hypothetical protein